MLNDYRSLKEPLIPILTFKIVLVGSLNASLSSIFSMSKLPTQTLAFFCKFLNL
jgi:hypothetical protein